MIRDDVVHEDHVALVMLPGQPLHFLLGAIIWVDLVPVLRLVSELTTAAPSICVKPIELLYQGRRPDALEASPLDLVELIRDAFDGSTAPTGGYPLATIDVAHDVLVQGHVSDSDLVEVLCLLKEANVSKSASLWTGPT